MRQAGSDIWSFFMTKKESKKENRNTSSGTELPEDATAEGLDALNVPQTQAQLEESVSPEENDAGQSAKEEAVASAKEKETAGSVAVPDTADDEDSSAGADALASEEAAEKAGEEAAEKAGEETAEDVAEEAAEEVAEEEKAPLKPGAQLAQIREAAGIEQEVVASSLKMTLRQIRALETDDYEVLHGIAISRGFVRAYAKFLQVDPEPLVALFPPVDSITRPLERPAVRNRPERVVHHTDRRFGDRRKSSRKGIIIALGLLVVLAYGAYIMKWLPTKWIPLMKSSEVTQGKPAAADAAAAEAGKDRSQAEAGADAQAAPASEGQSSPGEPAQQDKAPGEAGSNAKADEQAETPQVAQAQEQPAPPPDLLLVRFKGPSNVRILHADGSVINEFDGNTGDVQMVEINEPSTLVVEKADNVDVEFRAAAIFLKAQRRTTEARVELK